MDKNKPPAGAGLPPVQAPSGGKRGNRRPPSSSSSPGGTPSGSATPAAAATPASAAKKAPSNTPQNQYKRALTQEINTLKLPSGAVHTPDNSRLLDTGHAAQELGRYHEHATREHWKSRAAAEGPKVAAEAARASQSRLGSAMSVPALHQELAPPKTTPGNPKGTQRQSLKINGTHVAIPTDYDKIYPETTVALKDKGGRSTAYPVMAIASVHPAQGRAPSHRVLTTLEGQRSDGRDAVSTLSKGRLLQLGELTPADAIAVDKHGTFELSGAQTAGDHARARDVIARNTGNTVEQYGRSSSPRGQRLFSVIETLKDPKTPKRKRHEALRKGSKVLAEIEPSVFDARRTPPGSPDYHATDSHFGLSSPTPASPLSSMPAAAPSSAPRALSPLVFSPLSPPVFSPVSPQATQTTSSAPFSPTFASSPSGLNVRKVARRDHPAATFAPPPPTSSFPAPTFGSPSSAFHPPGGAMPSFSFSPPSAFSQMPRSQSSTPHLSPFLSTPPSAPTRSGSTSVSAPGPSGSHSGSSHSGPGSFSTFPTFPGS